jgi:hypothetical protein
MSRTVAPQGLPLLPHRAWVPWHRDFHLQPWTTQVLFMETWLDQHTLHAHGWQWTPYSLHQVFYCGVDFVHAHDHCVFLLRWSEGVDIFASRT